VSMLSAFDLHVDYGATVAFRWGQWRTVTKTATVSLHGNHYEVDAALAGCKVELVFDPFDLSDIDVNHHGRSVGKAVPFRIGRHVHPKAHADTPPAAAPTGIDYLRLVADRHTQALGEQLQYARLSDPTGPAGPSSLPAPQRPPAENGLPYDTDLLALATTEHAGAERDDPPPMSGPDPALEAELDSFAALLKPHSTRASPAAATDPKEHQ
jgi:hypothetical protein